MTRPDVVPDGAGLVPPASGALSECDTVHTSRDSFAFSSLENIGSLTMIVLFPFGRWIGHRKYRYFVKYYVLASVTLLYFDHVITFPLEIRRIWRTRFTGATLLFLLNRYIPFFGYIPVLVGILGPPWNAHVIMLTSSRCRKFAPFVGALSLISNAISAIILILRTYALYNRAIWVLLVAGSFGAASVAIGAWSASSVEGELFSFQPIVTCVPMLLRDTGLKFAWIMTFCFDFVVFSLTIARTYRFMKTQTRLHIQSRLTMLLLRDGSIYFLVMSIVNAANYILSVRLRNSFFASATGTNSILANVISVTMISRLLLNLREEAIQYHRRNSSATRASTTQTETQTDTNLIFTSRIFGNLTAELDYDDERPRGFRSRGGSENYYSYNFSGEESDEVYELQSRSTRSGFTGHSEYTGGTIAKDLGSSPGRRTFTGSSSSGSRSGTDSGSKRGQHRDSTLGWAGSIDMTMSSMTTRQPRGEPRRPTMDLDSPVARFPLSQVRPRSLPHLSSDLMHSAPALIQSIPRSSPSQSLGTQERGRETEDSEERKHDT